MVKTDQDVVSIADILDALETMLAASDNLRFTNRLRTLVSVDLFLSDPSLPKLEDAREFAVFDILTTIIRENYQRTRQIFGLTPVLQTASWVEAKQAITQETQKNSTDLLSWSCLYYCYIRVDLNISAVSFGEVVGIVERSVRRYRRKGLFRLYHALVSQEWEIRARQRVRRLRLQLPNIAPSLLFGREGGFEKIQKLLAEDFAFKLFISGAAGIGKSALVEAYIRAYIEGELPEAPQIDELIWVDSPKGAHAIYNAIDRHIYVENTTIGLQEYLLLYRAVIVIDNLGNIEEQEPFYSVLLQTLQSAQVIVINREFIPIPGMNAHLVLNELNYEETRALIEHKTIRGNLSDTLDLYAVNLIWSTVGGNPRSITLAAERVAMGDLLISGVEIAQIGLEDNYQGLTQKAVKFFAALMLYPSSEISVNHVIHLYQDVLYAEGFSELIRHHMVEVISREPYVCTPVLLHIQYFQALYAQNETNIVRIVKELIVILQQKSSTDPHFGLSSFSNLQNGKWLGLDGNLQEKWMLTLLESNVNQRDEMWRIALQSLYQAKGQYMKFQLQIAYSVIMRRGCQWDEARQVLQYVIEKTGQGGNFMMQANALIELGIVFRCQGQYRAALQTFEKAVNTCERLSDAKALDRAYIQLAQLAIDMMDGAQALRYLKYTEITRETLLLASEAHLLNGDLARCQAMAGKAVLLSPDDRVFLARSHTVIGRSSDALQDYVRAEEHFSLAVSYLQGSGDSYGLARAQSNLASALIRLSDHKSALALLEDAIRTQKLIGDKLGEQLSNFNLEYLKRSSM